MVIAEDEVVISGIGGYFPRSSNIEELQEVLMKQLDCAADARWKLGHLDVCDKTGNVEQIHYFDASYFGIHRQQSLFMDPMTRMAMQNTLEALIDAGITPAAVRGRRIIVVAASSVSENDSLMFENVENGFGVTGQARAMMANRISYWLNVVGPSYSCDANWLGGFQALNHGYEAIRTGQCEAAIVVGANLTMNIYPTFHMKNLKITSADGLTRSFDENASGYGRSDCICVLFLQRADQARRHYASLVDVDLMFNGHRPGKFTTMNLDCARRFITDFYQNTGVDPLQVNYIESYGSSVKSLDNMELHLLDQVYNNGNREEPLLIGAAKSVLGHSEASAVFGSIVKVIISMESGIIPANKDLTNPINHPALREGKLKLITENTPWTGEYAAVNGFGLASSYGHALLRRNPIEKQPGALEVAQKLPLLHVLSTRNEDGIKDIIEKVKSREDLDLDYMNLINGVFTTHIPGFLFRGYVVKTAKQSCKEEFTHYSGMQRPVWFVYSGMGSQWLGMGKALLQLPIFAKAVYRCAEALKPFEVDLIHILTADDETLFDNILNSFVGIAAVQIGLTDVLLALGLEPDGIIGHSVGELGCAYADGCLTAEQMVLAAYYRGRASQEAELIPGLMAAVGIGATEAATKIPPEIDIACHNGPDSCTLSGPKETMGEVVKSLQDAGIFARLVNVAGIAYHSRYIRPAAPLLLDYLHKLIQSPKERSAKWLSSSVPQSRWDTDLARCASAEYLTNNLLSSVHFEAVLTHVPKDAVLIEIAPHGLLQAILRRSVHQEAINIPLTKRGHAEGLEFLFTAIGKMFLTGVQLNISALYEDSYTVGNVVPRGTPSLAPLVRWSHTDRWRTGIDEFKDYSSSEQTFPLDAHSEWFHDISGHRINNSSLIPATAYLPLACKILSNTKKVDVVEFTNILVKRHRSLPVKDEYIPPVRVMVQRGSGLFEVSDRYGIVANGQVIVPDQQQQQQLFQENEANKNDGMLGEELYKMDEDDIYRELAVRGLELDEKCKLISEVQVYENGIKACIEWKNNWSIFALSMLHSRLLHPSSSNKSLVPGFILRLVASFESLPEENSILKVRYYVTTDTLWSPFIQIQGSVCTPVKNENLKLFAAATRYVPHYLKSKDEDESTLVDICLQIAQSQLKEKTKLNVILCPDPSNRTIHNIIKEINTFNIEIQLHITDSISTNRLESLPCADLLIIGPKTLNNLPEYLQQHSNTPILICTNNFQPSLQPNVIEVLAHEISGIQYRLIKPVCNENVVSVNVMGKTIKKEDLDNANIPWVQDLITKLQSYANERIYFISRSIPDCGTNNFVKCIQDLQGGHKVRFVFILDKNAPNFSTTESFYQTVIQQDLVVMIYENGCWGSNYTTTVQLTESDLDKNVTPIDEAILSPRNISLKIKDVDVQYVGIHTDNFIPIENNNESNVVAKLGLVDYSGTQKGSNKKIMGICNGSLNPDPILRWTVPDFWSSMDGATVPTTYAQAYYILIEKVNLQKGETILIHNASTGLGQALINVAFNLGAKIFASVSSEKQQAVLLNYARMLTEETVFDYTDSKFDIKLLAATQGEGVRVIINCARGERLRASLRCLCTLSRVVLLQDEADRNSNLSNDSIGMSIFLRCIGLYSMYPTTLLDSDEKTKRQIHQYVQNGLDNLTITPIVRNLFENQSLEEIIRYASSNQLTGCTILPVSKISQIQQTNDCCNPKSTYIVFNGDSNDVESVYLTAAWLARHGARKILLVTNLQSSTGRAFLQRQLKEFSAYIEIAKSFPSRKQLNNVAAIIVLPEAKLPATADLPSDIRLVLCTGTLPFSLSPTHPLRSTLRWDKNSRFNDAVHFLHHALTKSVDLMVLESQQGGEHIVEETFTYKDFFRLLAGSVPSLAAVKTESEHMSIKMITSASPRYVMEVPPLFIVPGLLGEKCKYLMQAVTKFMCPVYVVNLGQSDLNVEQLSVAIAEQICEIFPEGPYNILGVSTGGVIALETAKYLEEIVSSNNVQLYLVDAVPSTLKHLIQEAETNSPTGLDGIILQNFLLLHQPKVVNEITTRYKTWQARLNATVQLADMSNYDKQLTTKALNMIRHRLHQVLNYTPSDRLLNAPVRLLRPHESSKDLSNSLANTCKQIKVEVIKGNHFTMMQSLVLVDYINDNCITGPIYS